MYVVDYHSLAKLVVPNLHQKEQVGNRAIHNCLNSSILQKSGIQTPVAAPKITEIARLHCLAFLSAPGGGNSIVGYRVFLVAIE